MTGGVNWLLLGAVFDSSRSLLLAGNVSIEIGTVKLFTASQICSFYNPPPVWQRSIVTSLSVCLSATLCACLLAYLENLTAEPRRII